MEDRFDGVPEENCSSKCPGPSGGSFCGGSDGEMSVYIAECKTGEKRLADHCYFISPLGAGDFKAHQDACAFKVRVFN